LPTTWQDVREFAEFSPVPNILDQYGVVLSAKGAEWVDEDEIDPRSPPEDEIDLRSPPLDAALLLFEVLMASGKEPWDICTSWDKNDEGSPLHVLRDIYKMASPRSSETNWQTATGHLLSRHVALARNWSFSIATMRDSGELQHFHPHAAWAWKRDGEKNNRFRTLLGGDIIALPRYGRYGDDVYKLLQFLISKDAQKILVEGLPKEKKKGLTWPPMRFDVGSITDSEDEKLQDTEESQQEAQDGQGNNSRAKNPDPDVETQPIVGTSSQQPIEDKECHGDRPPTGEKAAKCARLHLYLARNVVREAMLYAEPTPRFWSPEMHESFTLAFHALVSIKDEEDVAEKLEKAAGLYCLAPESETLKDKQEETGKMKLDDFINLHIEGYPYKKLNDVLLGEPKIRVKLVDAKDPGKAASYHTDLCVQLDNPELAKLGPIKIPAGFTSALSKEPVATLLPHWITIQKDEAQVWELEDPDADCELKLKEKAAPRPENKAVLVNENPSTVVVFPFTLLASLLFGVIIGMFFFEYRRWKAAIAPSKSLRRRLQVVLSILFILVVPPLVSTLERLEYTKEVSQFFSNMPVHARLIPLALLLGIVLETVVKMVARSKKVKPKPDAEPPSD
jgi:hypothetical protein